LRDYDWLATGLELKRSDLFRLSQCHCIVVAALMIVLHLVP